MNVIFQVLREELLFHRKYVFEGGGGALHSDNIAFVAIFVDILNNTSTSDQVNESGLMLIGTKSGYIHTYMHITLI